MYTVTVTPYSSGYVSLPVEEKLFSRFDLSGEGNSYDTAEIEFSLVVKRDRMPFGIALSALADITKNLPAPMNPFSEGFKYFADYANKVLEGSLHEQNNVAESCKEAKVTLSFSSTDKCEGDQETTGTIAIVKGAEGRESEGYVNIKKANCWKAEYKPVFTLKFAVSKQDRSCKELPSDEFIRVNNPYVAFFLNAEPKKITTSQNRQVKTISLPEKTTQIEFSSKEVEKSISSVYDKTAFSPAVSSDERAAKLKMVSGTTDKVLKNSEFFSYKTKTIPGKNPNQIQLHTTEKDSLAVDLAQSLKRCASHGVSLSNCF